MPPYEPGKDYFRIARLSWSGFRSYNECPKKYWYRYVISKPARRNEYHSLGGKVIQAVFERFYNDEIWRQGADTQGILREQLVREFKNNVREMKIDWDASESALTPKELFDTLVPLIPQTLALIKKERLLGRYARSEVVVQAWVDKVLVHGITDFVIRRQGTHILLDGKLTRHRDKYLKRDQLVWYVMLFYLQHRKLVEKTGWVYYTYGELDWVDISMEDVKRLYHEVQGTIGLIRKNRWNASPSDDACKFCDHAKFCDEGKAMVASTQARRAVKRQKGYEDSGSPLAQVVDGVGEIGF